jgi:hypothetical protein
MHGAFEGVVVAVQFSCHVGRLRIHRRLRRAARERAHGLGDEHHDPQIAHAFLPRRGHRARGDLRAGPGPKSPVLQHVPAIGSGGGLLRHLLPHFGWQIPQIERDLATTGERIVALNGKIDELLSAPKPDDGTLARLKAAIDAAELKIVGAKAAVAELDRQRGQVVDSLRSHEDVDLRMQLQAIEMQLAGKLAELQDAQSSLAALRADYESQFSGIADREVYNQLEAQRRDLGAKLSDLRQGLAAAQDDLGYAKKLVDYLSDAGFIFEQSTPRDDASPFMGAARTVADEFEWTLRKKEGVASDATIAGSWAARSRAEGIGVAFVCGATANYGAFRLADMSATGDDSRSSSTCASTSKLRRPTRRNA